MDHDFCLGSFKRWLSDSRKVSAIMEFSLGFNKISEAASG